ncbi:DUF3006 domain-containing protein [Heyndrickxia sp. NPDC080065]|uniref:DUF3006 domain-containing protein n=1 Tax=Heyndrickxia sp. NPDC080065 TaxID=3390568 RepID=UPI003D066A4A
MKYVIDQLEDRFAVCEDESGNTVDIERSKIPKSVTVGDVLILKNGKYVVDKNQTEKLRKEIEDLMDDVWDD